MKEIIVKYWSSSMQIGLVDIKTAYAIIDNEVVQLIPETNGGSLRFRHKKKVYSYLKIRNSITHTNYKIQEYTPF